MKKSRTWQEKAKDKTVWLSPTQLDTAALCLRKWWFHKVRRLPVPEFQAGIVGTALHSIAERYFEADDRGYGEDGNPVDLFPEGWEKVWNKYEPDKLDGELSEAEQEMCRKFAQEAQDSGVWQRMPAREVEAELKDPIAVIDGHKVMLKGFIDVAYKWRIEDHKTTKSTKWAKGPALLKQQIPMNIYAHEYCSRAVDPIEFRYNYFSKEDPDLLPWEVTVNVTWAEIDKKWQEVLDLAGDMVRVRAHDRDWRAVRGPYPGANACRAYGGCPFANICQGCQTPESYEENFNRKKPTKATAQVRSTAKKGKPMASLKDLLAKKKAASPAKEPEPEVKAEAKPEPEAKAEAKPEPEAKAEVKAPKKGAPWAVHDCMACEGEGFNSKGNPCRICLGKLEDPSMHPDNFDIVDGVAVPKPEPEPEPEQEPEAELEAPPAKAKAKPKEETKPAGRPKGTTRTFVYRNCMPISMKHSTETDLLRTCAELMAKGEGVTLGEGNNPVVWYLSQDPFKRRDALYLVIEEALESHKHVAFSANTPDINALYAACKLLPSTVLVEGI